jgi:hypothetical protein
LAPDTFRNFPFTPIHITTKPLLQMSRQKKEKICQIKSHQNNYQAGCDKVSNFMPWWLAGAMPVIYLPDLFQGLEKAASRLI